MTHPPPHRVVGGRATTAPTIAAVETYANVCLRGHVLASDLEMPGLADREERFCDECGSEVISECPKCRRPITGARVDAIWGLQAYQQPSYCRGCGKPYPWTEFALRELDAIVDADPDVPAATKPQLKDDLRELTRDEPAPSAVRRASTFVKKVLNDPVSRQVAINTISEAAKRMMSGL
jgi:hypothetical protein